MFSRISTLLFFSFISLIAYAQTVDLQGRVTDESGASFLGATVSLYGPETFIQRTFTDTEGLFSFKVPSGTYRIMISMTGFSKVQTSFELKAGVPFSFPPFVLKEDVLQLKEAVVKGTRSAIRFEAGKTIVSPANSVLMAQSDAFNLLKNVPGVFATEEGGIRVNGQAGVNIQVDGREVYLSGAALVNFLKSLAAGSIENIEVISNPGSAHDASAKAGVINIRLKKSRDESLAVNAFANHQKSKNSRSDWGTNLSYGKSKAGYSIDYSGGVSNRLKHGVLSRNMENGARVAQQVNLLNRDITHNLRMHADFKLSEQFFLDIYAGRGFYARSIPGSSHAAFYADRPAPDSTLFTDSYSGYEQLTHTGSLRGRYKNQKKQELTIVAHGLSFVHDEFLNMAGLSENQLKKTSVRDTVSGSFGDRIGTVTFQADWLAPLSDKLNFQSGLKHTRLKIGNHAVYHKMLNGEALSSSPESMRYRYEEAISAAYVRLSGSYRKWSFNGGLRMENTAIAGSVFSFALLSDTTYRINYLRLFPSFSINRKISDARQLTFNYSRHISRPNYRDLSPSGYIVDKYTMVTGNTDLQPEMTQSFDLSYIFANTFRTSLTYLHSEGTIGQLFRVRENGGLLITSQNMASRKTYSLRLDGTDVSVFKWWKTGGSVSILFNRNKWQESGGLVRSQRLSPLLSLNNSFVFGKDWAAEANAYYNGFMALGQASIPAVWSVACGIRKKFLNDRLTVRLSANDIFASIRERSIFKSGPLTGTSNLRYEETYLGISMTYLFRKGKQKETSAPLLQDKRSTF